MVRLQALETPWGVVTAAGGRSVPLAWPAQQQPRLPLSTAEAVEMVRLQALETPWGVATAAGGRSVPLAWPAQQQPRLPLSTAEAAAMARLQALETPWACDGHVGSAFSDGDG